MESISFLTCCLAVVLEKSEVQDRTTIAVLLELLMLQVNTESQSCPGIKFLEENLPTGLR